VGRAALGIDLVIIGCTSVAVLTAPVALALLPTVLLLSAVQRDPRRPALIAVGCCSPSGRHGVTVVAAPSVGHLAGSPPAGSPPAGQCPTGSVPAGWVGIWSPRRSCCWWGCSRCARAGGRRPAARVGRRVLGVPLLALPLGAAPTRPCAGGVLVAAAAAGIERDLLARSRPARRYSPPDRRERPNRGGRPERFEPRSAANRRTAAPAGPCAGGSCRSWRRRC